MSYLSFSQGLTPKVRQINGITYYCFTSDQSKEIAKHIRNDQLNDSIIMVLDSIVLKQDSLLTIKRDQEKYLQHQVGALKDQVSLKGEQIELINNDVLFYQKQIRKQKKDKVLMVVGALVSMVLCIAV